MDESEGISNVTGSSYGMVDRFINGFNRFFYAVFSYSTVREARIHNFKVTLIFRVVQVSILAYIIGWNIVRNKGYQSVDNVSSAITTKVKGVGYVYNKANNQTVRTIVNNRFTFGDQYRYFDVGDYIIPPIQDSSIFVMTNFIETVQWQGACDEDYRKVDCICKTEEDCENKRVFINNWNGLPTGKCIKSSMNASVNVCEVISWCPVEGVAHYNDSTENIIQNVENFTIFIKNDVQFKLFNVKQRNILPNITNNYIAACTYDSVKEPYCPVFSIGNIIQQVESDPIERKLMFTRGSVIQIEINWNCNYDLYWKTCMPTYSFNRFDLGLNDTSAASGFNFRFSEKFLSSGTAYRTLVKAYGLRFIIQVSGRAGKFSLIPFLTTIGSGIGLLSIATIIADCVLLNFTKKRQYYQQLKALDYRDRAIAPALDESRVAFI